ncbi:MAG: amidophosphoribosyltransferase [Muribaculaceae bacterium]|nr:amidophosphoribosyltransferase [Muribaculaceae bacterium]
MEQLKHECGIALIRLLKPLSYYREKYGTYSYGINKLYLLMEKQHNRGQEGAGLGVVKLHATPGDEYVYRERALGSGAITEIFDRVRQQVTAYNLSAHPIHEVEREAPFIGELYMGHLRYSTTGRSGMNYIHPFLRRNNWRSRNLMLCGNFNMTNVETLYDAIVSRGQHPRLYSDTIMLLEQLGYALDKENHRLYRSMRDSLTEPALSRAIEYNIDIERVLKSTAPGWDGGYVICGTTGSGDMFALRDRHGIRPAFYYQDDEVVVVASERPVIATVFNVTPDAVTELDPGKAVIINKRGETSVKTILLPGNNSRCSFERVYFSRGSDADIYRERKQLGMNLVPDVLKAIDDDIDNTVFSFIPNTAEVAFMGLHEGLEAVLEERKMQEIQELCNPDKPSKLLPSRLREIMQSHVRVEKVVIKDIKLRTFIAEGESRNDLAAHVYDITYGTIRQGVDTLAVIDDSIVRGTTLRQSILAMLGRLKPRHVVVISSSPQVRYPDCYGIDMSRMAEFVAFRAAVALLQETGREDVLTHTYNRCVAMRDLPDDRLENCVKAIYEPFTEEEISRKIAQLLTPEGYEPRVTIIYQSLQGLHKAIPGCPGDWYFSGDYPTPGGIRLVNQAFINYYEGNADRR